MDLRRLLCPALLALAVAPPTCARADTLRIDGVDRHYTVQTGRTPRAPLVIVLHGNSQQGEDMRTRTAWPALARREGFAVAFPDGLGRGWADGRGADERDRGGPPPGTDDVAFLDALAERLVQQGVADPARIYVAGVSNGGAMAMTLACRQPQRFAAVASAIMAMTEHLAATCRPAQPVPMLILDGTADPLVPFDGSAHGGRLAIHGALPAADTVAFWRRANGCAAADGERVALPDRDRGDHSTVTRIASRCPAGADVLWYRVDGGGHRLPGTASDARHPRLVDAVLGPQNHDIDGAEVTWAFFRQFPAAARTAAAGPPTDKRVVLVVLENEDAADTLDAQRLPFLWRIAHEGAYLSNYRAVAHPSQPNYVALVSGSSEGVRGDGEVRLVRPHLGRQLTSWATYAEGYPTGTCDLRPRIGRYARKHEPFLSFADVQDDAAYCAAHVRGFEGFVADARAHRLPRFSLVVPDLRHDGHDAPMAVADAWLQENLGPLLDDPAFRRDTVLIVTFDENGEPAPYLRQRDNLVYAAFWGDAVRPGTFATPYTHYDLLRTLETMLGAQPMAEGDRAARVIGETWR